LSNWLIIAQSRQGAIGVEGEGPLRERFLRFWCDTSCGTTIEYGFIVAGIALAIFLALEEIGAEGRTAAREFFHTLRFSNQP
jgi:Flp pilus assembly pilin Flp